MIQYLEVALQTHTGRGSADFVKLVPQPRSIIILTSTDKSGGNMGQVNRVVCEVLIRWVFVS